MALDKMIVGPDSVSYLPPFKLIDKMEFRTELAILNIPLMRLN